MAIDNKEELSQVLSRTLDPIFGLQSDDWRTIFFESGITPAECEQMVRSFPTDEAIDLEAALNAYKQFANDAIAKSAQELAKYSIGKDDALSALWSIPVIPENLLSNPQLLAPLFLPLLQNGRIALAYCLMRGVCAVSLEDEIWIALLASISSMRSDKSRGLSYDVSKVATSDKVKACALFTYANAAVAEGDLVESLFAYEAARRLDPWVPNSYLNAAKVMIQLERFSEGMVLAEQGIKKCGENADLLNNLGICLYGLGKHDGAIAAFKKALAFEPSQAAVLSNLTALNAEGANRKKFPT